MIKPLNDLIESLCRLPTVGKKSAWRLALHILESDGDEARRLADSIINVKQRITRCIVCGNYSERETCPICSSPSRSHSIICVVERPSDLFSIEESGFFKGVYHVLGGVLSPINGITSEKLNIHSLEKRIKNDPPEELILALGGSSEAETTSLYLAKIFGRNGTRITRLARGMPAGLDLEYVDQLTLSQALNERTDIQYEQ